MELRFLHISLSVYFLFILCGLSVGKPYLYCISNTSITTARFSYKSRVRTIHACHMHVNKCRCVCSFSIISGCLNIADCDILTPTRLKRTTKPVKESPPVTEPGVDINMYKGVCGCLTTVRVRILSHIFKFSR